MASTDTMIKLLNHKDIQIAQNIRAIFQVSYAVEADLLQAIDFPPLKRNLTGFQNCKTDFYGFHAEGEIAAVIEIKNNIDAIHIQSLVVDPYFFRQGIAIKLMHFVLEKYKTLPFTVETGVLNIPAIQLYKKLGFVETLQWDTDHGVRKVRFEKHI
jgi:ribosomal protein S18 acetylase RimI-like enzyme